MNPLPQRKKSAGEIAKLRESFGIPGQAPGAEKSSTVAPTALPEELPKVREPEVAAKPVTVLKPEPVAVLPAEPGLEPVTPFHEAKAVHPHKRSEQVPVLALDDGNAILTSVPQAVVSAPSAPATKGPKLVRSLRKSEQGPVVVPSRAAAPTDSKLPAHRHSDQEISRIRRLESIGTMSNQQAPRVRTAHLALVVPGYLLVAVATVGIYYSDALPFAVNAACLAIAMLIAIYILIRKPLSRHHAAFIAMAALLLVVFGALHYFPQIQHGT